MTVAELIEALADCAGDMPVVMNALGWGGTEDVWEVRQCKADQRCKVPYVELSSEDVPEEYLGDEL
jgi:hypothetical protein